jgi:hypothetical protein
MVCDGVCVCVCVCVCVYLRLCVLLTVSIVVAGVSAAATLEYVVRDCDPNTGVPDEGDGYPDEYMVCDDEKSARLSARLI